MKSLFYLYKEGLKKPRIFMASFELPRRQIWLVSWIAILIMSISLTVQTLPIFDSMMEDIHNASHYIPEYTTHEGQLTVSQQQKPVYYQSEFFQLVFDTSIESNGAVESLKLPQTKQQQIKNNIPLNVFIFKNQAFVLLGGSLLEITDLHNGSISPQQLKALLDASTTFKPYFIVVMSIVSFIFSSIFYGISVLIMALMAGIYNKRLSRPVPFKLRFRAMVILSFLPIIVFEMINMMMPYTVSISYIWVTGLTLWQYFRMLKDLTIYIMSTTSDLQQFMQQQDEETHQEEENSDK